MTLTRRQLERQIEQLEKQHAPQADIQEFINQQEIGVEEKQDGAFLSAAKNNPITNPVGFGKSLAKFGTNIFSGFQADEQLEADAPFTERLGQNLKQSYQRGKSDVELAGRQEEETGKTGGAFQSKFGTAAIESVIAPLRGFEKTVGDTPAVAEKLEGVPDALDAFGGAITPDFLEEAIGDKILEGLEGYELMDEYEQLEIRNKLKTVELLVEVFGVKGVGGAADDVSGMISRQGDNIGKKADDIIARGEKEIAENFNEGAKKFVIDDSTPSKRANLAGRTTEGTGLFGSRNVALNASEKASVNALKNVDGINLNKSFLYNLNRVTETVGAMADDLITQLKKNNVLIPKREVFSALRKRMDKALAENIEILNEAQGESVARAIFKKAEAFVAASDGTAAGLLDARKKFDAWSTSRASKVFEKDSIRSAVTREARDAMNEKLIASSKNVDVKKSLRTQSKLLNAGDVMATKAGKEASSLAGRAFENFMQKVGIKNQLVQAGATMMGIGGLGAAATFAPVALGAGTAFFGTKFIYQLMTSPIMRVRFGKWLKRVEKAIPEARTPDEAFSMADMVAKGRQLLEDIENTPGKKGGFANPGKAVNDIKNKKARPDLVAKKLDDQDAILLTEFVEGKRTIADTRVSRMLDDIGIGKADEATQKRFIQDALNEYDELGVPQTVSADFSKKGKGKTPTKLEAEAKKSLVKQPKTLSKEEMLSQLERQFVSSSNDTTLMKAIKKFKDTPNKKGGFINLGAELNTKRNMPKSDDVLEIIKNSGAKITDDGLSIKAIRFQPEGIGGETAIRSGVFYLPEANAKAGTFYKGKTGYGGSEKLTGEITVHNPMIVKGATGGKAPELAYDMIEGKGAYQKMRSEVLDEVVDFNMREADKLEAIQQLLEKYAKYDEIDSYDFAYDILRNSKEGNTLPYAIQEHIVASKVRDSGFDSVIGYSQKRDGTKYFSEIFDVRETTYPIQGEQGTVHADFLVNTK